MASPCDGLIALYHIPIPPLPPAPIAEGAQTVRINNLLAARVSSKLVCGAAVQQGALTVYYGGPTQRVLAVFDLEAMLLSALGFAATASLIAMALLTIPFGVGAMATFAAVLGGFVVLNYGLGVLGDRLPPGWTDILQGSSGLLAISLGAFMGVKSPARTPEPTVKAKGIVGGMIFDDVNQTARPAADPNKPTLIADRIALKEMKAGKQLPNGNMATAHAEVGVIQQAYDAGVTQGADMTMVVNGQEVCSYCRSDIVAMARQAGLASITISETETGTQLFWKPGLRGLQENE